ncbi:UDP-glucuronosyl/UDP-glucosyltransferase family-containing protein [Strongyloides ratti]|uniref:glucuronosyltransferase n=1 Tax=Strongyloides ratti TaxID=34506 RepID=A0A090LKG1_STRRB|nr:UDP-glucuronosyl/UDP-glucosyltransferase family-containing protein [Strongyloides ratti]CEF70287.1 UDP-glucuronosyl/UDP-glucosyltransferase family-containing protein [Strongyloides ratti]
MVNFKFLSNFKYKSINCIIICKIQILSKILKKFLLNKNINVMNFFILLHFSLIQYLIGYKILIYSPEIGHSHVNFNIRIANTLIEAGHNVTYLKISIAKNINFKTKANIIETTSNKKFLNLFNNVVGVKNMWTMKDSFIEQMTDFSQFTNGLVVLCQSIFEDDKLTDIIRNEKYDIFIGEFYTLCPVFLKKYWNIENSIFTSAMTNNELLYDYFGLYFPSSYVPTMYHNANDNMPYLQRWSNFIDYYISKIFFKYILVPKFQLIYQNKSNDFTFSITEIAKETGAIWINTLPFIDFPSPITSKLHYIGGAGLPETKPLDDKWNNILNKRDFNVLISFGSIAKSYTMLEEYKKGILKAFTDLSNITFIWKYEKNETTLPLKVPSNVIIIDWIPQNDLLNDNRLNLFITHGGINSIVEAASRSTPIICVPLFGDQKRNAGMVQRLGFSEYYDKENLSNSELLKKTILKIIHNKTYSKRANRIGTLMKDVPFKANEIIIKTTEFIGKNGNIPEMNLHGSNMGIIEFFNLDIIFILIVLLILVFLSFYHLTKKIFKSNYKYKSD